jgi:putative ABC transport system ATP-binding protein
MSIAIKDLVKNFGSGPEIVHALKKINLEVKPNQITMIVGPSGSGKTTLLSCIAGTLHFDSGEVNVLGHELETLDSKKLTDFRAFNIGFIFQEYHLIPTLTCVENVSVPLLIQKKNREDAFAKAKQALERVGLADKFNRLPKEISGGQQQRVAIARAIVHEPPIIICDEPTASLDYETGLRIMEILKLLSEDPNRTVIIVTHDHRIFHYAEKIVEMDDGNIKQIMKNQK